MLLPQNTVVFGMNIIEHVPFSLVEVVYYITTSPLQQVSFHSFLPLVATHPPKQYLHIKEICKKILLMSL
jgi:hypothetical protein